MTLTTDDLAVLRASEKFLQWRPYPGPEPKSSEDVLLTNAMAEKHWSVTEVARQWGVSTDLIRDVFKDEDGVLVFERPGNRTKRSYSTMRIPESVLERVYNQLSKR